MKAPTLLSLAAALLLSGCCTLSPVTGTSREFFRGDGPETDTNTGSLIVAYGNYLHPPTQWWLDCPNPPANPGARHTVSASLGSEAYVTGVPAGWHCIYFRSSGLAQAPCPAKVKIEKGRTVIVSVDYHEDIPH